MLVIVALGGNALLRRGEPLDAATQRANLKDAAKALADLTRDHRVVFTHGNGPQVGLLALQNDAYRDVAAYPLDVLDAETEGMVGYLLEQELGRHIRNERLATLLTQVIVDPGDSAFSTPTKYVGPIYLEDEAKQLATARGWAVAPDGNVWRRVVPSPDPIRIVELDAIRILLEHDITVICAGGGGIPVVPDGRGLQGVEAVVDKDLSAALLATQLNADALLLLTDVDAVYENWGTADQRPISQTTPNALRSLTASPGSMGPKIEAVSRFIEGGGLLGGIGSLHDASAILRGEAGTIVRASTH